MEKHELVAFIYQIQGDFSKSKKNYQKAIDITISLNKDNYSNIAISYLNYSNFLISIDQFTDAEEMLKKSFQYIQLSNMVNGPVLSDYYKIAGLLAENKPVATQNLEAFKKQKKQNINNSINF